MHLNMRPHGQPGLLVVVCGPDGSGKSTLEDGLVSRLQAAGVRTEQTFQPTDWWRTDRRVASTMVGGPDSLSPLALAAFALADRLDHQDRMIAPVLAAGGCLVTNRYLPSLLAHFMTTREVDLTLMAPLFEQIFRPDLLLVLDAPTDVLLERVIGRDGPDSRRWDQQREFVARNREAFQHLAHDNDGLLLSSLDSPQSVLDRAWERLTEVMAAQGPAPASDSAR